MTPVRPLRRLATLGLVVLAGCEVEPTALDPSHQPDPPQPEVVDWVTDAGTGEGMVSDILVPIDPRQLRLVPDPDREDGIYRFEVVDPSAPELEPGHVIYGGMGEGRYLRRVLEVERSGDVLTLRTGTAFPHEVIRSGTYSMSGGMGAGEAQAPPTGPTAAAVSYDTSFVALGVNLCTEIENRLGRAVCGGDEKVLVEKGVLELDGRVDSLAMRGLVDLGAEVDGSYTIYAGGEIVPGTGRAPVFDPCNSYPNAVGCFSRVGDALRSFLASIGIDPNVLPPARLCIPGTPIVIRRATWWPYRPPVVRVCRITDWGALPTYTLPSLQQATVVIRPRIRSNVFFDVAGTGTLELTIPVPDLAVTKCFDHGNGFLCLKLGLVAYTSFGAERVGGTVNLQDLESDEVTLTWTASGGWSRGFQRKERSHGFNFVRFDAPDTVRLRVGPAVLAEAKLCFGGQTMSDCYDEADEDEEGGSNFLSDLQIGVDGEIQLGAYLDGTWSRDAEYNNWHVPVERLNALEIEAGLILPKILIKPDKNLVWSSPEWQFGQMDWGMIHGTGALSVETLTSGALPDPDGYSVSVSRANNLPEIASSGVTWLGPLPWEKTFESAVGTSASVLFDPSPFCGVVYSDAYLSAALGTATELIKLARRHGLAIPNYAVAAGCGLLVADYFVELTGVAENCVVSGENPKLVRLSQTSYAAETSRTKEVLFEVDCPATAGQPGSIEVTVATTVEGGQTDPDGYTLRLDAGSPIPVQTDDAITLDHLTPRNGRTLTLEGVAFNCGVQTGNPLTLDVLPGAVTAAHFEVWCGPIVAEAQQPGSITVHTATTGSDIDTDGFLIALDEGDPVAVTANGTHTFGGILKGSHAVTIGGVASNCSVAEGQSRSVDVKPGQEAEVTFELSCEPADLGALTGSVEVSVSTSGVDLDPDGYNVTIGALTAPVDINATVLLELVTAGTATVRLEDVAPQCHVEGGNPVDVPVGAGQATAVQFEVTCSDEGSVAVSVSTEGSDPDPDGYTVILDGVDQGAIGLSETLVLGPLKAGEYRVGLGDLAPNCVVLEGTPQTVEVIGGQETPVGLSVDCAPLSSLGAVEVKVQIAGPGGTATGLSVIVDGAGRGILDDSGQMTVSPLLPGNHRVELGGVAGGCRVSGQHPRTILVPQGRTMHTTFVVACSNR